ncbi:MAG: aminotransferase class I/II-fold pyridoxal phosphate-dependent enzyme [Bifidobacteriaceae bacterium]|jgi:cystathionine beta-lyase|nr:aminotransferase class I/II-fold pyridoxal phosphate-dependent enzyme [Bifidobacteriaceae bacterium]
MNNIFNVYSESQLRLRTSKKWGDQPESVIPLDIAEVDVPFDKSIAKEIAYLTRYADCGYVSKVDIEDYKNTYMAYYFRKHSNAIDIDKAVVFPGVIAASRILSRMYFDAKTTKTEQRNIIISSPVYPPFITTIAQGCKLHDVPLNSEWRLDLPALAKKFKSLKNKPTIYLLCNPQNPTGTVHTPQELKKLIEYSNKYNIFIISDEIYSDMSAKGKFNSLLCLKTPKNAIAIVSPSKAYGMPGLKSSIVFPFGEGESLVAKTPKVIDHILNHYPIRCAIAAYSKGDKYLANFRASLDKNFSFFDRLMVQYLPKAKIFFTGAVPLAWVDMSSYKDVDAQFIYDKAKVSVNNGEAFGGQKYKSFVRFNVATNQAVLKEGIIRISRAIENRDKG